MKPKYPHVLIVIPARLESHRLKRKLLLDLHGHPVFYWAAQNVRMSNVADYIIATDSNEIYDACIKYSFPVTLTSKKCKNGTERVYETARKFSKNYKYFVNVQADEPLINTTSVEKLIGTIGKNDYSFKTAISKFQYTNKNNTSEVKVAISSNYRIRYASRNMIPYFRDNKSVSYYKIQGIYIYPLKILEEYITCGEGILERSEKIEQLRCIENDLPMYGVEVPKALNSIDTDEDYKFYQEKSSLFRYSS